jgi:PTH2 family peptidyl-tRNA hydrolase
MREFEYKQAIVFRSDLKLGKGKIAAQAGHAAVSAAEEARKHRQDWWMAWISEGQKKIAVKVPSEKDLLELKRQAGQLALPTALIIDAGLTQIPADTTTCLGIGPGPTNLVDRVTGKLRLL